MKPKFKSLVSDPDNDGDAAFHAQKMSHHEGLAAKHRALADHHRSMHRASLTQNSKSALKQAALQIAAGAGSGSSTNGDGSTGMPGY